MKHSKKLLLTLVVGIMTSLPLSAQGLFNWTRSNTDNYYGLRMGFAMSNIHSDNHLLQGGNYRMGLNVAAVIGISLSMESPLFIETGLAYSAKGGRGNIEGKRTTFDMNYLELPIVAKYRIPVGDHFTVDPFVGGYFALGISGRLKNYVDRTSRSSYGKDRFGRFDSGLRFGVGASYDLIYLEAAYDFGLANLSRDAFESSHLRGLIVNLGVNF